MSIIYQINLNHLRIFQCVFKTRSMTVAAKELHLTQSGISQHIKSLEEGLGVELFDRFKQKIIPTGIAETLYEKCAQNFQDLESALIAITGKSTELSGTIRVAMPMEFGTNLIVPIASQFLHDHPLVQVRFVFGLSHEITELVINGEIDFAYVDEFTRDKRVTVEKVHDEPLDMVCSVKYLKSKNLSYAHKLNFYECLDYIDYVGGEPVVRSWFRHHLKSVPKLNVRAYCASPTGIMRMVQENIGVGVVPRHLIKLLGKEVTKLSVFSGCGKDLLTPISIAYLTGKSHSPVAFEFSKAVAQHLGLLK